VLGADDIAIKSPGDGLPPFEFGAVIGRRLRTALQPDDNIAFELLDDRA
jgi:sialic acid synthase